MSFSMTHCCCGKWSRDPAVHADYCTFGKPYTIPEQPSIFPAIARFMKRILRMTV